MKTKSTAVALLLFFAMGLTASPKFYSMKGTPMPGTDKAHDTIPASAPAEASIATSEGAIFTPLGSTKLVVGTSDGTFYITPAATTNLDALYKVGKAQLLLTADQLPPGLQFPTDRNLLAASSGLVFFAAQDPKVLDSNHTPASTLMYLDGNGALATLLTPGQIMPGQDWIYSGTLLSVSLQSGLVTAMVVENGAGLHVVETRDLKTWKTILDQSSGFAAINLATVNTGGSTYVSLARAGETYGLYRITSGALKLVKQGSAQGAITDIRDGYTGVVIELQDARQTTLKYSFLPNGSDTDLQVVTSDSGTFAPSSNIVVINGQTAFIADPTGGFAKFSKGIFTAMKLPKEGPTAASFLEVDSEHQVVYGLRDRAYLYNKPDLPITNFSAVLGDSVTLEGASDVIINGKLPQVNCDVAGAIALTVTKDSKLSFMTLDFAETNKCALNVGGITLWFTVTTTLPDPDYMTYVYKGKKYLFVLEYKPPFDYFESTKDQIVAGGNAIVLLAHSAFITGATVTVNWVPGNMGHILRQGQTAAIWFPVPEDRSTNTPVVVKTVSITVKFRDGRTRTDTFAVQG